MRQDPAARGRPRATPSECRQAIAPFAELERAPEHVHTYRLTPLGPVERARRRARRRAGRRRPAAATAATPCRTRCSSTSPRRWPATAGCGWRSTRRTAWCCTRTDRAGARGGAAQQEGRSRWSARALDADTVVVHPSRARPPQAGAAQARLAGRGPRRLRRRRGAPDRAATRTAGRCGPTSSEAVEGFWHGGSGVVVLPCGAGKTIVGAAAMAQAQATTLILVTNTVARPAVEATSCSGAPSLTEDEIGEYSGARKEIRPVTIATYQVMTTRRKGVYAHLELFDARDWGLIVYDEVHLLPAPIFRMTADLQARRRLGLTATLVREDGREGDVFSLIGPKRYDAPWKDIEAQGYIAPADCVEVRVTLPDARAAGLRDGRARGALPARVDAPTRKTAVVERLVAQHRGRADAGHRPVPRPARRARRAARRPGDQGRDHRHGARAAVRGVPHRRDRRCSSSARSRTSRSTCPRPRSRSRCPASFGSRQEEAQRLGRVLRPKADGRTAHFYTVVTRDTVDAGLRRAPAAVPGRAGLRLPDRRRRRPAAAATPRDA